MTRHMLAFAFSLLLAGRVLAAPAVSDTARAEIEGLFTRVGASGCEFYRNGAWLSAKDFTGHLRKKYDYYDYLPKKGEIHTAEDFIRLVGTESSQSGKAYQVRCAGAPAVTSSDWLMLQLTEIRRAAPPASGKAP